MVQQVEQFINYYGIIQIIHWTKLKMCLVLFFLFASLALTFIYGQERLKSGIGILPTGSEIGINFRSSKDKTLFFDARVSKVNILLNKNSGGFINEASLVYRISQNEKLRFNIGLGLRTEWNFTTKQNQRYGMVLPIGIEAFPFPFQNGGLFFEIAPYFSNDKTNLQNIGVRSSSGFIYYFTAKSTKHEKN
jgi:hypothetical protein